MNIKKIILKIKLILYKFGIIYLDPKTLKEIKEYLKEDNKKTEAETFRITTEYISVQELDKEIEEILFSNEIVDKPIKTLIEELKKRKIFDKRLLIYIGYEDEIKYFKVVIFYSLIAFFLVFFFNALGNNIIGGIFEGIFAGVITIILAIFYPRLKLIIFKGEIKLQILFTTIFIISILRAGASIMEAFGRIASSKEFGILHYEFKEILKDINFGYTIVEALNRAKKRTEFPLLKIFYDQLIIGYNKGNLDLLLEKFYEEIVRESLAKLDSSKFMIQNLGNLAFGTGIILPFSGMIISTMMANQGVAGVISTLNLLLTKIGPMLTLIFSILVKIKIE